MTDAPERIWTERYLPTQPNCGFWCTDPDLAESDRFGAEYLRADLVPSWQPIETAPRKPGDDVLLWWDRAVYTGFWNEEPGLGYGVNAWVASAEREFYPPGEPTHWMPLPEPPDAD